MIFDRHISSYVVLLHDSIPGALTRISENKAGFVIAITERGTVEGVLTDGDVRRWMIESTTVDLKTPVSDVMTRSFVSGRIDDPPERIEALFSARIKFVPLLDAQGHLIAVAREGRAEIVIEGREVSETAPIFLIAEIGNNHNGSLEMAKRLIDLAVEAGADCVKFQMRHVESLYAGAVQTDDHAEDLGSQYVLDLLSRVQLAPEEMAEALAHVRSRGAVPLCTPWDRQSLKALERFGVNAYKVASADLTNLDLLQAVAETRKPVFLSTGMSEEGEIRQAVALLQRMGSQYVLMHCNSAYPAPFKDVNLSYLEKLKRIGGGPIGYSGHERGYHVALAAVARGARVVEKHFTDDKTREGNDHRISLLPSEFKAMAVAIRDIESAIGDGVKRISQGEMMNRETLAKSVVAATDIPRGRLLRREMLDIKSPGRGVQPNRIGDLVGRPAPRDMAAGDFFYPADLEGSGTRLRAYTFDRPWGIAVRPHDYAEFAGRIAPDFLEFHLSFKDMDLDVAEFLDVETDLGLVVHAPEIFAGDYLLDLASPDPDIWERGIEELQRVIDVTRALKPYFPKSERPPLVVNVGGFTKDGFLPETDRPALYDRVWQAMERVDLSGVELLPQTMPPFPWLFGGQLFHNLFLDADGIRRFHEDHGMRVCLDVSHSKLACNHFGWSFRDFVEAVAPIAGHLHLVDARGVDDEGLQIGDGEIDFAALAGQLNDLAPGVGFIPEIWQGHKNEGEGFAVALDRLEQWF